MMKFSNIPKLLTGMANYEIQVGFNDFCSLIKKYVENDGLILNPEFQRGHVWTTKQQEKYVEYILRGGKSGKTIYLNKPGWNIPVQDGKYDDFVCVDGLQRITAVMAFHNGEIKAFGHYIQEYEDSPRDMGTKFTICINDLQEYHSVLRWYVEMNEGGTPHTEEELDRVRRMVDIEMEKQKQ